jgi:hypothetical protein
MDARAGAAASATGGAGAACGPAAAVERAVRFLERSQLPDGAFRVYTSSAPDMSGACLDDASVFPTALIAHCLTFAPAAAAARQRAVGFLAKEMDRHGLWRHWTREHPQYAQLPPDLDDTSCASAVLAHAGRPFPDNRRLLLANRRSDGRFLTWIIPRPRLAAPAHMKVTLPQLVHLPTLWLFFRRTSASPADIDAVVNANVLHYLGPGAHRDRVARWLVQVLRDNREGQCDKWYENPFAIWYFFARALGATVPEAGDIIEARIAAAEPATSLDAALAVAALSSLGRTVSIGLVARLLEAQLPDGAWPRAALYHGGRARLKDGRFGEPHPDTPRWGSEELTTAFCVEALSRLAGPDAP